MGRKRPLGETAPSPPPGRPGRRGRRIRRAVPYIALLIAAAGFIMLITQMPGESYSGPFEPLSKEEASILESLHRHVLALAGEIGERNLWRYDRLDTAARYIEGVFRSLGLAVSPQEYEVEGKAVRNIAVECPGVSLPEEIVIAGAHYDTVPGSPGANDNASGVAALLVLAELLRGQPPARTIRLVAFVNEEPPFFQTMRMGSRVYAAQCRRRKENIVAMLSLETIGCYSEDRGSQHYPFPFSLFYPDTGNFLGFVGNLFSRSLVRRAVAAFRSHTRFPSEGAAAPGWITGIGWSDHWSFWKEGYPAVMLTDTALFRYPHYHALTDTPDRIDYDRMARVVRGIARVVADLAGEETVR